MRFGAYSGKPEPSQLSLLNTYATTFCMSTLNGRSMWHLVPRNKEKGHQGAHFKLIMIHMRSHPKRQPLKSFLNLTSSSLTSLDVQYMCLRRGTPSGLLHSKCLTSANLPFFESCKALHRRLAPFPEHKHGDVMAGHVR